MTDSAGYIESAVHSRVEEFKIQILFKSTESVLPRNEGTGSDSRVYQVTRKKFNRNYLSLKSYYKQMNKFIDITDRPALNQYLAQLQSCNIPQWGSLTPLQLLEHLVETIEYSNGKKHTDCTLSKEEAEKRKQFMIYTDAEIPMGIKTPKEEDGIPAAIFTGLIEAIAALNSELDTFEKYFAIEGAIAVHPGFGALQYKEWLVFHGKHFTHHLKQFGLWR